MRKPVLLCIILAAYIYTYAQHTLTGKVTDSQNGAPVSGASIKIRHAKGGTSTDANGQFTLPAKAGDMLEVSSIG